MEVSATGGTSAAAPSALVYAEVSIGHDSIEAQESLPPDLYRRGQLPFEAAFLAGKAILRDREAGGVRRWPRSRCPGRSVGAGSWRWVVALAAASP